MRELVSDLLAYALAYAASGAVVGLMSGPAAFPFGIFAIEAPAGGRAGAAGLAGASAGIGGGVANALVQNLLPPGVSLPVDCLRGGIVGGVGGLVAGLVLLLLLGPRLRQPPGDRRLFGPAPLSLGIGGLFAGGLYIPVERWLGG